MIKADLAHASASHSHSRLSQSHRHRVGARAVLATGILAGLMLTSGAALAQRPPTQMNPLDRSDLGRSKQNPDLRGVPVPATVTPLDKVPLAKLKVPLGFTAEIYAHGMPGARTMVRAEKGTIFVGSRTIGRVYAITEKDGKRETKTILQGLSSPNGLAVRDGALYVFAINKVFRYDNIEDVLAGNPEKLPDPVDLSAAFNLPSDAQHGWKFVAFGPDGKLYVPVGANCNICEINPATHAHIRRYNADGTGMEIVARGVRNTVGFDWHPVTKELWFTDNGRDWAGDGGPEDELNRLPAKMEGASFGFPYCHANNVPDQDVKKPQACAGTIPAAALMGPHAAALGMKFYTGDMFPAKYKNAIFAARHGSWNRSERFGYDVVAAFPQKNGKAKVEPFMTGLLDKEKNAFLGRPTHVMQAPDGSLMVSDELSGVIYRISYNAPKTARR
ncbi:MAG: PQQ-dependent sugar dehydrogenase [Beijerinckiaceae bacterium]|nr:PQQ-dependent sugar dehydrogenase [Beijerinckiaceae bacterium]